jgi:hypothetical protein
MNGGDQGPTDPLAALRDILGGEITDDGYAAEDDDFADVPVPTHWPSLPAVDAGVEWADLTAWVDALQRRFAALDHHLIPRCWWRHNGHVEALAALRDHERSSFADTAPATAPLDWFRALRDISALLRSWTGDLGCGASHQEQPRLLRHRDIDEWDRHVREDTARRRDRQTAADRQRHPAS